MKLMRVFLNPDAQRWVDIMVPDDTTMLRVWPSTIAEGLIANDMVAVPRASIHHIILSEPATQPSLTVFPGGKPN